jgi:hypothetical protein
VTGLGIVRDEACYPSGVDAWMPLVFTPAEIIEREPQRLGAIVRLSRTATTRWS